MSNKGIPNWALRFLQFVCPEQLLEEIEGDLLQRFNRDVHTLGERKARRKFIWNSLAYCRPGILLRNRASFDLTPLYMVSNYFKVAVRVMLRNKAFSAINIAGLAFGTTGALLLFLWIAQEMTFEQHHADSDRLYVAWNRSLENGELVCWETTPRILAPTLKDEYAPVEHTASYAKWGTTHLLMAGDTKLLKTSGVFTDAAIFNILTFNFKSGDAQQAFSSPNSIVITKTLAEQLFGTGDAFGRTVTVGQSGYTFDFVVTAVLEDLPAATDFKFEYLISFAFLESLGEKDTFWGNNSVTTLVKLREGHSLTAVNESIKDIEKRHYADGQHIEIFLYPLTKMRLYSRFENGVAAGGRIEVMRMLGILGVCLLAIACINFINLSTARAQRRSKEVAVRKVTGAFRMVIAGQFLLEAVVMAAVAGVLSLVAVYLLLPFFNTLIGQTLSVDLANPALWITVLGIILALGLLAGSYPAFYLSAFKPVQILKGTGITFHRSTLRSLLVVLQFGFAVTLVVSAIVVRKQILFVQNRDAGYSRDNLVYVPLTGDLQKNFASFANELTQQGTALSITQTSAPITEQWSSTGGIEWTGKNPEDRTDMERVYMDNNATATFGLTIVQGRDFDLQKFAADSTAAILNETAARAMGFKNPVGEIIADDGRKWQVVGVVRDFVFTSPFRKTEPIVLFGAKLKWAFNVAYIKMNPVKPIEENLATLKSIAVKHNPEYPFEYHLADLDYQRKFDNVRKTLLITTIFTFVAIFIAGLGLLGLATHMAEVRIKEIGIRKVMGGSTQSIAWLLSYSSLKPILIAIVVFMPLSWMTINWWLQSFAYRVSIDASVFAVAAISIVAVALLTISTQILRAAGANPVESLRNE